MRLGKEGTRRIAYVSLAVLAGLVILLAVSPVIGVRFDVILSGSMSPSMNKGDLVVIASSSPDDLRVGDVIVFRSPIGGSMVCHRIISIQQEEGSLVFQTKGDNNEDPDPFTLGASAIVGKVHACVPFMGNVVQWLRGPFGLLAIITLAAIALLIPEETNRTEGKETAKEDVNGEA